MSEVCSYHVELKKQLAMTSEKISFPYEYENVLLLDSESSLTYDETEEKVKLHGLENSYQQRAFRCCYQSAL